MKRALHASAHSLRLRRRRDREQQRDVLVDKYRVGLAKSDIGILAMLQETEMPKKKDQCYSCTHRPLPSPVCVQWNPRISDADFRCGSTQGGHSVQKSCAYTPLFQRRSLTLAQINLRPKPRQLKVLPYHLGWLRICRLVNFGPKTTPHQT